MGTSLAESVSKAGPPRIEEASPCSSSLTTTRLGRKLTDSYCGETARAKKKTKTCET